MSNKCSAKISDIKEYLDDTTKTPATKNNTEFLTALGTKICSIL